jgi:hypothetical protein
LADTSELYIGSAKKVGEGEFFGYTRRRWYESLDPLSVRRERRSLGQL